MKSLSLAVVGADYPNKRGPGRRFELAMCQPGEPIELRPEPKNPADEHAIAVFTERGIQIGYVTAERAPWIGKLLGEREVRCIYQGPSAFGAWIRCAFDGEEPTLPAALTPLILAPVASEDESGFWPDEIPPEE